MKKKDMKVFMSKTTRKKIKGDPNQCILSVTSKIELRRCQALVNFEEFKNCQQAIAKWLQDSHKDIGCKPDYMYLYSVDGGKKDNFYEITNAFVTFCPFFTQMTPFLLILNTKDFLNSC